MSETMYTAVEHAVTKLKDWAAGKLDRQLSKFKNDCTIPMAPKKQKVKQGVRVVPWH